MKENMEEPKGYTRGKGANYWVLYQPKDDPFTYITYYVEYGDALEMYNAVKVIHRERRISVRIELLDLRTHEKIFELNNTNEG